MLSSARACAFVSLLGASACASGQPAVALINPVPPPGAPAPATQPGGFGSLDQVLDALDQRGQDLKSFSAEITLIERDEDTQLETTSTGKVWYERKADGKTRIRVSLVEKKEGNIRRLEPVDYVLDGGWLIERQTSKRIQVRRQIFKPGQEVNLFRLGGDGAFPMPIGQKKEEVKKQFEASLEKVTAEDKVPAGVAHVSLKPRKSTDLEKKFSLIDIFVDPATHMPIRVDTLDSKGTKSKSTKLDKLVTNPALNDQTFELPKIQNENLWQIREEPLKQ